MCEPVATQLQRANSGDEYVGSDDEVDPAAVEELMRRCNANRGVMSHCLGVADGFNSSAVFMRDMGPCMEPFAELEEESIYSVVTPLKSDGVFQSGMHFVLDDGFGVYVVSWRACLRTQLTITVYRNTGL